MYTLPFTIAVHIYETVENVIKLSRRNPYQLLHFDNVCISMQERVRHSCLLSYYIESIYYLITFFLSLFVHLALNLFDNDEA